MWFLEQGLQLVRELDEIARDYNYHICLGGSVLIEGESNKDIDIYAMPFHNKEIHDDEGLIIAIKTILQPKMVEAKFYHNCPLRTDNLFVITLPDNRRIDFFVIRIEKPQ